MDESKAYALLMTEEEALDVRVAIDVLLVKMRQRRCSDEDLARIARLEFLAQSLPEDV
ncbi:MAG: hypothetical protein KC442_23255 [Thermomicrobiales bacterium]|nr:hypothetical protein [Thermomicrobiales bacterium]